jgi:hypothetical protein
MSESVWTTDHDEVIAFATHLVDSGEITEVKDLLYFYEKPWKWAAEYEAWKAGCGSACEI